MRGDAGDRPGQSQCAGADGGNRARREPLTMASNTHNQAPPLRSKPAEAVNLPAAISDERVWLAATLAVTALIYSRCLGNEFAGDDQYQIVFNHRIGEWSLIWKSLFNRVFWFSGSPDVARIPIYRPMHDIWLWFNFRAFGLHPAGWHAAMVALFLIAVWMAFRVTSHLTSDRWTAVLATALFALTPVHAEVAIWPPAVASALAAAFELAAFDFYLVHCNSPKHGRLAISLGLFACALLSYEAAVVFPALIAAYAAIVAGGHNGDGEGRKEKVESKNQPPDSLLSTLYSLLSRGGVRRTLAAAWPYALESIAYLGVRQWIAGPIRQPLLNDLPMREALLTIPNAIVTYSMLLLMPWRAGPAHRLDAAKSIASPEFYMPVIGLGAICGLAFLLLRRHPHRRLYLFCGAWILIALGPLLNLKGLFGPYLIQDRYLYLASFGFCMMAGDLAISFGRGSEAKLQATRIGAAAVAMVYAGALFSVQHQWHDDIALFSRCVKESPESELCHGQLGDALAARGDFARARHELESAVKLEPEPNGNLLYDLGLIDQQMRDWPAAERAFAQALKRLENSPATAYANLALIADIAGDKAESEAALKQAEAIPGGAQAAALTRAQLARIHGDLKGSESVLRDMIRRHQESADVYAALGVTLSAENRPEEALAPFQQAMRITPGDPNLHYQAALLLHRLGREREAHDECAAALAIVPGNRDAQALMAAIERGGGTR
jgi:protein O-mannosyl-transferase